jgi:prepilin peptidase CpaA
VFEYAVLLFFPAVMAFAGAMDLLTMTIPNRISLALAASFVAAAPLAGLSLEGWLSHIGAGVLVLAAGIIMFSRGWLGGGDAKLLAAAALWVGFDDLLVYCTQVAVLGGLLALLVVVYRRLPVPHAASPGWAVRLHERGTGIPYGLAIAGAALMIYPRTHWFAAFAG